MADNGSNMQAKRFSIMVVKAPSHSWQEVKGLLLRGKIAALTQTHPITSRCARPGTNPSMPEAVRQRGARQAPDFGGEGRRAVQPGEPVEAIRIKGRKSKRIAVSCWREGYWTKQIGLAEARE